MINYSKPFFLLFAIAANLLLFSCGTRTQSQEKQVSDSDDPFVEFLQFHERFLTDSVFQMEHVLFPLEGLPSNADSITLTSGQFRWEKENWELHRPFKFEGSDFERRFIPFDDDLIIENIVHKSGNYASERRFAKIEGEWYMIYYAGLNMVE